jgi:cell filamentation protein, protein adenylyltransferase
VSTTRDWDRWIRFFARGLAASAQDTEQRLMDLLAAQGSLKATIRRAGLRANTASHLVDFALAQPIFTVRQVERHLEVTYARANKLVAQLVDLGVLSRFDDTTYGREFTAPEILAILLRG